MANTRSDVRLYLKLKFGDLWPDFFTAAQRREMEEGFGSNAEKDPGGPSNIDKEMVDNERKRLTSRIDPRYY